MVEVEDPDSRRQRLNHVAVEERNQHVCAYRPACDLHHYIEIGTDLLCAHTGRSDHSHSARLGDRLDEGGAADRAHRRDLNRHFAPDELGEGGFEHGAMSDRGARRQKDAGRTGVIACKTTDSGGLR